MVWFGFLIHPWSLESSAGEIAVMEVFFTIQFFLDSTSCSNQSCRHRGRSKGQHKATIMHTTVQLESAVSEENVGVIALC